MTLSSTTTPGQSGRGSDGNEEEPRIPQSSCITGASPSDCIVSYPRNSLAGSLNPLQRCSRCIWQPQQTGPGKVKEPRLHFYLPIVRCKKSKVKHKQPLLGFELGSRIWFPMIITIILGAFFYKYCTFT